MNTDNRRRRCIRKLATPAEVSARHKLRPHEVRLIVGLAGVSRYWHRGTLLDRREFDRAVSVYRAVGPAPAAVERESREENSVLPEGSKPPVTPWSAPCGDG